MKEAFYFIIDISEHLLKRCLIIYLFHDLIAVKERYAKHERFVEAGFVIVTTVYYFAVNYIPFLQIMLYGNEEGMTESRRSILPMFLSMLIMLVYCLHFYKDKKQSEISKILGVSQVQVSRLESKIIEKLKKQLTG